MCAALDHTLEYVATCNRTDFADHEDLTNFDQAQGAFALLWREHATHRSFDLINRIVNDVVVANIDTTGLSQFTRRGISTHIKANNHGLRCQREVDVGFTNATDCGMYDLYTHFGSRQFLHRCDQGFLRTLDIGFDDQCQVFDFAFAHLLEHIFELGGLLFSQLHITIFTLSKQSNLACFTFISQHHHFFTSCGDFS